MKMASPEGAGQLCGLEVVQHDQRECARFYAVTGVSFSRTEKDFNIYPLVVYLFGVCSLLLPGGAG